MDEAEIYELYISNLDKTSGFYADQVDEKALAALYNTAFQRGQEAAIKKENPDG